MGTVKLLIVSNHRSIITKVKKVLDKSNFYICGSASKFSQAQKLIQKDKPDIIIVDPNKNHEYDGVNIASTIDEKTGIPFIFLSDKIDRKSLVRAKRTNACSFISTDFLTNEHFPIFMEFAIKSRSKVVLNDDIRDRNNDKLNILLKEVQSFKNYIKTNTAKLNTLNLQFAEFQEKTNSAIISKDKFFSIIAHDMKGPLQGLIGYTEILSQDCDSLEKSEIKEIATDLNDSAKLLLMLLEDFLHWARIQRGAVELVPSVQNIKKLVDINIDLLSLQASQKKIKLINKTFDLFFIADLNMINTVIRNLISNSIKFTNNNGKIIISSKDMNNDFIEVSVTDDGIGMSEENISKLFKIDTSHSTIGTANEKGTGLGLILCKELIEKNNGTIRVESRVNKGTTFFFTIPKAKNKK